MNALNQASMADAATRAPVVSARNLLEDALDRIQRVSVKWRAVPA